MCVRNQCLKALKHSTSWNLVDLGWVVAAYRNWRFSVRQFRLGDARQLDTVPVELLARAWTAAAGSGDEALTIDVDSPIYETYRLAKQGGTKFTCKHVRSYHPLYAVAARTGDIVTADCSAAMPTPGGARPFHHGTSTGCEPGGATGAIVHRADSGFYNYKVRSPAPGSKSVSPSPPCP